MSALQYIRDTVFPAAFALMPPMLDTPEAKAMLVAIGLQESRFTHRHQIGGPARGFWQFEEGGGLAGVLRHHATRPLVLPVLDRLGYPEESHAYLLHRAIEHNDILACVFARLNLYWLPQPLPGIGQFEVAWGQYLDAWRPGKPHRQTWDRFYDQAWQS